MIEGSFAIKTASLIFTGACLAIGFWAGKKLTNRIDEFLYVHSREFKQFVADRKDIAEEVGV